MISHPASKREAPVRGVFFSSFITKFCDEVRSRPYIWFEPSFFSLRTHFFYFDISAGLYRDAVFFTFHSVFAAENKTTICHVYIHILTP